MTTAKKSVWVVAKTRKGISYRPYGSWLNKLGDFWLPNSESKECAKFTSKGEARKALNKKLSFEIKNWGLEHVEGWIYKVEQIDK